MFGVVDVLGEGCSIGGDSEEGFAVFISSWFGECFGDLEILFVGDYGCMFGFGIDTCCVNYLIELISVIGSTFSLHRFKISTKVR